MDELLSQAYYDLIYTLLTQPRPQVPSILKAQAPVVDDGFLVTLQQTAATLAERGCPEDAEFLTHLAQQLQQLGGLESYLTQVAPSPTRDSQPANPQPVNPQPQQPVKTKPAVASDSEQQAEAEKLFQQGLQQFQTNHYTAAFQAWQQALLLYREINDIKGEIHCLSKLGSLYQSLGQYQQAISCHQQSFVLARKAQYSRGEVDALNSLGLVWDAIGQYKQAIATYQQALATTQPIQYRVAEANIFSNLGKIYAAQGQMDGAIQSYQQALAIAQAIQYRYGEINFHSNLGNLYTVVGQTDQAIAALNQGLDLAQSLNYPLWQMHLLAYLGKAYQVQGKFPEAIATLEQSLGLARAQNAQSTEANLLSDLAKTYQAQGSLDLALDTYQQALALKQSLQDQEGEISILNTIGQIVQGQHRSEIAIHSFRTSLNRATPTLQPWEYYRAGQGLGELGEATDNPELVLQGYGAALEALTEIDTASLSLERRSEFQTEFTNLVSRVVQTNIQLQRHEQALEQIEFWRSQQQVMAYAGQLLPPENETLRSDLTLYQQLHQQIQVLIARRQSDVIKHLATVGVRINSPATQQAETAILNALNTERQKIWQTIREQDPVLAAQLRPMPIQFLELQALVKTPNTALLNFYATTEQTYLFILRSDQLHCLTCSSDDGQPLQLWFQQNWLEPMVKTPLSWRDQLPDLLAELAQRLQLERWVSEYLTEIQNLVIVPDHILSYVPFAALPFTEPEPVESLKSLKYFGDRFRLRILPDCQSRPQGSQATTSASASNLSIVEDTTGTLVLSSYTSQILTQRHQIPDTCYLRATTATVENYETLFKQARTFYANHLVQVNLDPPLNMQIQCIDGTVSFDQLLTWRCSDLSRIVFSYCQSVFEQFESLKYRLSFVNSLLRIGAQEVVCPLWFLDNVAASLICLFWDQLAQAENSATALHQAQVKLRTLTGQELSEQYRPEIETSLSQSVNHQKVNDQRTLLVWLCQQDYPFAHPYYWAGFVVYGWGD